MLSVILAGTKGNKGQKKRRVKTRLRLDLDKGCQPESSCHKIHFSSGCVGACGCFCIGSNLVVVAKCISTMLGCHPMLLRKPRERRDPLLGSSGQSRSCIDPKILIPFTPLSLGYLSSNCQFSQCSNLTISCLLNSLKSSLLF
jgi:hypothetical protein